MKYGIYRSKLDCGKYTYWAFKISEDEAAQSMGYERIETAKTSKEATEKVNNLYKYGQTA